MTSPNEKAQPWFAKDRTFGIFWVLTSLIALIASIALTAERNAKLVNPDHSISCDINPWVSCGTVMESWQAATFGFPNQWIGLIGYAMMLAIAMALLAGAKFQRWYWWGVSAGATFALGFCIWLFSQAIWNIHALCLYCMVVWAMAIPQWVFMSARMVATTKTTNPRATRLVSEWSWVLVVLMYVGVAAAIFFNFRGMFFPAG